jgi:MtrB/PioB family decaheme-associated outer membrane protein
MSLMKRIPFGLLLLCVLSLAPAALLAADAVTTETEAEAVIGPQYFADRKNPNSAKFEEYRDVPNGLVFERFIFNWSPKPNFFFEFDGRDITQSDQRLLLEFGRRDLWKGTIFYNENPRLWTDRAAQLFSHQGGGIFTLDDTFQAAVQAAPGSVDTTPADGEWDAGTKGALIKSSINTSAADVLVGYDRRTGGFGAQFTPTAHWTFGVTGERERRSGTTPQSLGMYFSLAPAEVAAPLDFTTDTATLSAEYTREHWNLGAQISGSDFETGITEITWDNQLFLNDTASGSNANPARGRLTPWNDSRLLRWSVFGGLNLAGNSRIQATMSRSETTQDDPFLPMTTNTLLSPAALPATSLDGEYHLNLGEVRLSSRPLKWFRYSAWYRKYVFDNETPSLVFADYVTTDYQFPTCGNINICDGNGDTILNDRIQRRNLPYGYEKTNTGATASFRPWTWFDVGVTYELESMDRDFSAAEKSDEDIWKLVLDFDVTEWLTLRATARRQERRTDEYDVHYFEESFPIGEANVAAFNEGVRRFPWTDRDRDAFSLMADVTITPKISLYAEAIRTEDDYSDPISGRDIGESITDQEDRNFDGTPETINLLLAGRTDDLATSYTLGVDFHPAPRFSLFADYTWETWEYGLETRYRAPSGGIGSDNPLDNWGSDADDKYRTANVGFGIGLTKERRWTLDGALTYAIGEGDLSTHFVPGGNPSSDTTLTRFPHLESKLSLAQLALTHAVRGNLDYALRYWYEKWEEDNWASDQMQPYMGDPTNDPGSVHAVYLGMDFENYENHIVSFLVRYRFR